MVEVAETVTRAAPAPFAEPLLEYGMQEALRQYEGGPQEYYPGSTVVGFSPQQEQALRMQEQRALAGSPITQQAQELTQQTLGGGFLGGSPQLTGVIERALAPAQANVMSNLAQRGRLGSGAAANVMAQTLGDIASDIAYRDYAQERAYQQNALSFAPQMAQMDYTDIGKLSQVGDIRQQQAGLELGADINRFEFEQQAQQNALKNYLGSIGAIDLGSVSTGQTPYYTPSTAQTFLGGASQFAGLLGDDAGMGERLLAGLVGGGLATAF